MNRPEDKYVKIPAIIHATRIGYAYRSIREDAPGIDYDPDTNIFFEPFRKALERINGTPIDAERARHLANQIKLKASGEDLGRAFFTCLHAGIEEYRFIDFDDPSNNDFTVATELAYANGEDSFRPDITFLVNGMPLAFMEAKRQNNKDGILAEHERMHARFKNAAFHRFANIVQVMAFSNNQEYDDSERRPVQGSFYAASAYGHLTFQSLPRRGYRRYGETCSRTQSRNRAVHSQRQQPCELLRRTRIRKLRATGNAREPHHNLPSSRPNAFFSSCATAYAM